MVEDIKIPEENQEVNEVIEEIKTADEETLRTAIEKWYEKTRTDGLRLGAQYICYAVMAAIRKHTTKPKKTSMRDLERCIKEIQKIVEVPLGLRNGEPNDLEGEEVNDRATEETSESNS